jgi:two-component system response regulator FixJ
MSAGRVVHILDDDAAMVRSLERLLQSAGFETLSYGTPFDFLDAAPHLAPGCLLLDVRIPGLNGLDVQARLNDLGVPVSVVVMTGQGDVSTAVRAMKAGAVDFIEKPFADEVLIKAVEAALARADQRNQGRKANEAARRIALLSPREREVLEGLMAGHSNKVIAFDLGISVRTVEVHRARMMVRLGTRQLAEAIRVAVTARLASDALVSEDGDSTS